ncbi:MAG: FtsX-like permease family protein, partial [Bacteroidota bacterium]
QQTAEQYFGQRSPIGETLLLFGEQPLTVGAVLADLPANQHFHFDFVTNIHNSLYYADDLENHQWVSNNYRTYFRLAAGHSTVEITAQLPRLDQIAKSYYTHSSFSPNYFIQALTDIHLHSNMNIEMGANGDIRYVYLAFSIGLVILLLALINYLNLANARSSQRIKILGVRKVLGARKHQIMGQLLAEALLIITISFTLATGITQWLLPTFNQLMGLSISTALWQHSSLLLTVLLLCLSMGILVSLYPVWKTSSLVSSEALKGRRSTRQKRENWIKNSLIVGQFAVAILLTISTFIIYQQLHYTQEKVVGFDREQVLYIPYQNQEILSQRDVLRATLSQHPDIVQVTFGSNLPLNSENQGVAREWEGNTDQSEQPIYRNYVDYDYLNTLGIELLAGRNFSPNIRTDAQEAYLLNEAAVKALGWTNEDAVGKKIAEGQVIGVVQDYHFQPFQLAIEPLFFRLQNEYTSRYGNLIIKMNSKSPREVLAHVEKTVATHLPSLPADIRFLDESYAALYQREERFGQLFSLFSGIAILIACLGLFGLITHSVTARTKEIGIRKILGATVIQLIQLLSGRFIWQVILATLLATPLAWWSMQYWLSSFAYRIQISWWTFLWIGLFALSLAALTTGVQAWRAAVRNPVDTIKIE